MLLNVLITMMRDIHRQMEDGKTEFESCYAYYPIIKKRD
jgi:hypothetical protein